MSTPPVEGSPLVVYCGPGSDDIVSRQGETVDTGTGLVLSTVRTIAEAHGWEVTATESEVPALDDGRSLRGASFEPSGPKTPEISRSRSRDASTAGAPIHI